MPTANYRGKRCANVQKAILSIGNTASFKKSQTTSTNSKLSFSLILRNFDRLERAARGEFYDQGVLRGPERFKTGKWLKRQMAYLSTRRAWSCEAYLGRIYDITEGHQVKEVNERIRGGAVSESCIGQSRMSYSTRTTVYGEGLTSLSAPTAYATCSQQQAVQGILR